MSNGYDKYFKNAKKARGKGPAKGKPKEKSKETAITGPTAEEFMRQALKMRPAKKVKASFPWTALLVVIIGLVGSIAGYYYPDRVSDYLDRIQIGLFGAAIAAESDSAAAKSAGGNIADKAKAADSMNGGTAKECPEPKGYTEEELSHFNKLSERKKELDLRETELSALEEELHKQKAEVESRIQKLEQIRAEVATVLKERVEVDEQRVGTLVDFYSNMKPKQAAEIFGKLNEDLAVEILGKMKKKNAAEIMNLLEPAKARVLSEKFTGYKRR